MSEKKYTEEELESAMTQEYDTGYHNGWAAATDELESILIQFENRKDSWTWEEIHNAMRKAEREELNLPPTKGKQN